MRALGAKVVITPAAASGTGMLTKAKELAKAHGWYWARQFENEANAPYHANTTGPEILRDFAGHRLDYWVTGYGTGGTFTGAGSVLKLGKLISVDVGGNRVKVLTKGNSLSKCALPLTMIEYI